MNLSRIRVSIGLDFASVQLQQLLLFVLILQILIRSILVTFCMQSLGRLVYWMVGVAIMVFWNPQLGGVEGEDLRGCRMQAVSVNLMKILLY